MTSTVRRAGAFAALCTLSLAVPLLGPLVSAPIAAAVLLVALVVTEGPLFDLFALPGDYEDERLFGLITFVLAATLLGIVAVTSSMPLSIFVGTVLLVGYGNFAAEALGHRWDEPAVRATGFCLGGATAAALGQTVTRLLSDASLEGTLPLFVFLGVCGALLAALLRDVLLRYDDPLVMLAVGLLLWLLAELEPAAGANALAVAIVVTVAIGALSYLLGAASVAGMLTGILLGLLTIVLGGYGWFAVLLTFFALGSLSTKFRYDRKAELGVAEDNDGARGTGKVLSNSAVAMVAVLGYAASATDLLAVDGRLFLFAFVGALATATSDTLSSEIGGVFDSPRLITTFERVDPGTDGAVTWQGELAGLAGAAVIGTVAVALFEDVTVVGGVIVTVAGVVGMTADSLLGATLEGDLFGNEGVNFLATLAGALAAALLAFSLFG